MLKSLGINISEVKAKIKGTAETRLITLFVEKMFDVFSSIRMFQWFQIMRADSYPISAANAGS